MKQSKPTSLKPGHLPIIAVIFSVMFWTIDSIIDVVIFGEAESIIECFIHPKPAELWMRWFVVSLFITFSYLAKHLLALQIDASSELTVYKNTLEKIIDERTNELKAKNKQLEDEIKVRKKTEKKLEILSITDPLTLLYNRRKFNEILSYEILKNRRYGSGLSLIMCDIDNFKLINDKFGHETGDKVLQQFAQTIKISIRNSDLFARWGGEEFVFLIPDADPEMARSIAEKTRELINETEFKVVDKITISLGVATLNSDDNKETLLDRADQALYKAKEKGRNVVVIAEE